MLRALSSLFLSRQQPQLKLPIFECGAEQTIDQNNSSWLEFSAARVYVARTRVVYQILEFVRKMNI